ncbi:hypothetical protein B0H16DRAFT_1878185 [Mycena metata]|uniref:DNA polymerase delta subunit 4 n=1 Tax=Mycena metata TaxID=1033252 RepID=A0AAD7NZ88_9AGAR|nr:hypothetical protein B0H16DRAFT_1878185 [Mycena metata]
MPKRNPDYGPCVGATRLERWHRAKLFDEPPVEVLKILEALDAKQASTTKYSPFPDIIHPPNPFLIVDFLFPSLAPPFHQQPFADPIFILQFSSSHPSPSSPRRFSPLPVSPSPRSHPRHIVFSSLFPSLCSPPPVSLVITHSFVGLLPKLEKRTVETMLVSFALISPHVINFSFPAVSRGFPTRLPLSPRLLDVSPLLPLPSIDLTTVTASTFHIIPLPQLSPEVLPRRHIPAGLPSHLIRPGSPRPSNSLWETSLILA